jgi:GMP synthase (glutamine-hydrolysing)
MSQHEGLLGGVDTVELPSKPVMIADAGAQYVDVIFWGLVERGFRSEVVPFTRTDSPLDPDALIGKYSSAIYTGSGDSVNGEGSPQIPEKLLKSGMDSLGICYGAQAIAKSLGGLVGRAEDGGHHRGEYGPTTIDIDPEAVIYKGLKKQVRVLMSHGDSILELPEDFRATGDSNGIIASFESADGKISGTQFHPEVAETEGGLDMIVRFLENAGVKPDPNYNIEVALEEYMDREEAAIAEKLLSGSQIRGFLSGGVDSRVACEAVVRVAKSLDGLSQVEFYYVDTGHNRTEDDTIIEQMQADGMPVTLIDAAHEFFHSQVEVTTKHGETFVAGPLVEEVDPEIKRLIIGNVFRVISQRMMEEAQLKSDLPVYFVQGTNQSDIIESGGQGGKQIKGHHNVEAMDKLRKAGILIEPLRGLMKYHVRRLGEHRYGLPERVFKRQPFPGVGNSPRILAHPTGELEPTDPELQQRLDNMLEEMSGGRIKGHLVNMKTVGAQGDDRSLANAVFLEGEADWELLDQLSVEITSKITSTNRVLYVPGKRIDRDKIRGVRQMDDEESTARIKPMEEAHRKLMEEVLDLAPYLSQYFVASLYVDFTGEGLPTLAVRHFITGENLKGLAQRRTGDSKETFRTGIASLPGVHVDLESFNRLFEELYAVLEGYGMIAYDITGKPPGSTEFE